MKETPGMAVRQKQKSVIEFLHAESLEQININRQLLDVYEADPVEARTIRGLVRRFRSVDKEVMCDVFWISWNQG